MMRIVFMGTPDFARKPLERLYDDGHDIAGVFTQPDKPNSRGMAVRYSPVKELAVAHGTPVFQPASLKHESVLDTLIGLNAELIVVVAYGKILTREILQIPPLGCINIHGSLLPKYRGAAPIQWAVLNGESETGVTSMYIAEQLDAGDIISTKKTPIGENETAGELYNRLSVLSAELLSETVNAISRGEAAGTPQNHSLATYAPQLTKEMSLIDWDDSANSIKNKVRGLNPWPVATMEINGKTYKVFAVENGRGGGAYSPGEIIGADTNGLEIACQGGSVIINEMQAPGGKRMSASDYLRGHRI